MLDSKAENYEILTDVRSYTIPTDRAVSESYDRWQNFTVLATIGWIPEVLHYILVDLREISPHKNRTVSLSFCVL